jgi:hypothetical protein
LPDLLGLADKAFIFSNVIKLPDVAKTQAKCRFISLLFAISVSKMDKVELSIYGNKKTPFLR